MGLCYSTSFFKCKPAMKTNSPTLPVPSYVYVIEFIVFWVTFLVLSVVQSDFLTGALAGISYSMSSPTVKATPVQAKGPSALSPADSSTRWGVRGRCTDSPFPEVSINRFKSVAHFCLRRHETCRSKLAHQLWIFAKTE